MSESLQGQLLIAPPQLADPNFARTVSLLVRHDDDGALGLVLNRPTDVPVAAVWAKIASGPCAVDDLLHQGGPCEGPLVVVHDDAAQSEAEILPGLHFAASRDNIHELVKSGASAMKCFVGYAGWEAGQLENELEHGSWIVASARPEHVFQRRMPDQPRSDFEEAAWLRLVEAIAPTTLHPTIDPRLIPSDPSQN